MTLEKEAFINDWLLQEFRSRVKTKRKIHLLGRLADALKLFKVKVTEEERQAEAQIVSVQPIHSSELVFAPNVTKGMSQEAVDFITELQDRIERLAKSSSGTPSSSSDNASSSSASLADEGQ